MPALILIDAATKAEIGRRPMDAQERYHYYECCHERTLISFEAKQYRVKTVAWRVPEEDLITTVEFAGWEHCDCE